MDETGTAHATTVGVASGRAADAFGREMNVVPSAVRWYRSLYVRVVGSLVRDLVDLSRLENGVIELDRRIFATRRLLAHVRDRHLPEIGLRRIDVRVDIDDDSDQMFGDPDRLEQVIENLFANGLRHTPDAGCIMLSARTTGDTMNLSVSDSGVGIPPEHLPHVFERFYKADAARTHLAEGSGLGLSIAKAIVERHGGTIAVSSMPSLTIFTIQLPQSGASDSVQHHSASTNL